MHVCMWCICHNIVCVCVCAVIGCGSLLRMAGATVYHPGWPSSVQR
jgi:hypothetical protein